MIGGMGRALEELQRPVALPGLSATVSPSPATSPPQAAPAGPAAASPDAKPVPPRIVPSACLAYRGTLCSTCVERCPLPGAVLVEQGRPRIDPQVCDGCGVCVGLCPAPVPAIR